MSAITTEATLTVSEARRILRSNGYLGNVSPLLVVKARARMAAANWLASLQYELVSSERDDKQFEDDLLERYLDTGEERIQL